MTFRLEKQKKINYNSRMEVSYKETNIVPDAGFQIDFVTMKHNYPPHWHREMELLFILNGSAVVTMEGEQHKVKPLDLIVIDSSIVHEVIFELPQTMGIRIHISKSYLRRYFSEIDLVHFICCSDKVKPGQQNAYLELCGHLKELTLLYFEQKTTYALRSSSLMLLIMAELTEQFGQPLAANAPVSDRNQMARIEKIFQYVEQHYTGPIELQSAADELDLNKEYFCRFFKKNTGMSFLRYVNQVRLNHVYQDLLYSEGSIQEILERNGIYNNKIFYQQFKENFHCTPRELKQLSKNNPYL